MRSRCGSWSDAGQGSRRPTGWIRAHCRSSPIGRSRSPGSRRRIPISQAPRRMPPLEGFVAETAGSTPEARADAVGPVLRAAQEAGLNAAGALSTTSALLAVAHRRGLFAAQPETYSNFTCTARSQNSSGWVDRHRRDVRGLEVEAQGRIAIEKAQRSRDPQPIEPGRHTVLLEPAALAELVPFP